MKNSPDQLPSHLISESSCTRAPPLTMEKKDPRKPAPEEGILHEPNVWTFNLFIPNNMCQPQTTFSKVSRFQTVTIHGFPSSWGWPHWNHQPTARPRCQCSIYIVSTSHRTLWSVHGCKISNKPQQEVASSTRRFRSRSIVEKVYLIIPYSNILSLKEVDKPMSTEMVEYLVELFKVEI